MTASEGKGSGVTKRYALKMRFTVLREVEVEAVDEEEAKLKAMDCRFCHEGHDEDFLDWHLDSSPKEITDA